MFFVKPQIVALRQEAIVSKVKNIKALTDFVFENPDGFDIVESDSTAIEVMERLIAKQTPTQSLVERAINSKFGNVLIGVLIEKLENTPKWKSFLYDMLFGLRDDQKELVHHCFERETLRTLVLKAITIKSLADDFKYITRDATHPFQDLISADEYWPIQIRRHIIKCDYRRAWDEIKKASHGIPDRDDYESEDFLTGRAGFMFAISDTGLCPLIQELYAVLLEKNLVTTISNEDCTHERIYTKRGHIITGYEVAKKFLKIQGDTHTKEPWVFTQDGVMTLKIAAYANANKNQDRLRRREAKLKN